MSLQVVIANHIVVTGYNRHSLVLPTFDRLASTPRASVEDPEPQITLFTPTNMATSTMSSARVPLDTLFDPLTLCGLNLRNRFVMAPMTRCQSPGGIPTQDVARYYERRARGGVGLIVTEGTSIAHPAASNDSNIPRFDVDTRPAWRKVVDAVQHCGTRIIPQLWHVGLVRKRSVGTLTQGLKNNQEISPSGYVSVDLKAGIPMTEREIHDVVLAFGEAARLAYETGFDGIELQGAHGYLIDQFLWEVTNRRADDFGGSIANRSRFAAEIVRECRRRTHARFPIVFRFSQWKQQDYTARLAKDPGELEQMLSPLVDAGVDMFHCSQRRYWQPEFKESDRTLAGWTKSITGKPVLVVGSVGLDQDMASAGFAVGARAAVADLRPLVELFERSEFDLVSVGRAMVANPDWCNLVQNGRWRDAVPYNSELLARLD